MDYLVQPRDSYAGQVGAQSQLFGGIVHGNCDAMRKKSEYLNNLFGRMAFDNQTVWTAVNRVSVSLLDESHQFTIERSMFETNYDITFA